jgi:hypothetical protein
MIYMFAALQRFAEQRGDGLLPELADRLRKMPRLCDGRQIERASETEARLSAKPKSRGHS